MAMNVFVSDYFGLDFELDELGVFDAILDKDSNYFINLTKLKNTQTPEFQDAYARINSFFDKIALLLTTAASKDKRDRFYREARRLFDFGELNGINLGFSENRYGTGIGPILRDQIIADAYDIIKAGSKQPEIFQLVGLFEENIGPDRLSDMIATIIKPDIERFTKRILHELRITPGNYPHYIFDNGLVLNPYKDNCPILLLPIDILHELPIARDWDDIDRVVNENKIIRQEINEAIGQEWSKWASGKKKAYIKRHIFMEPERCARVIEGYRSSTIDDFDISADLDYFIAKVWRGIIKSGYSFTQVVQEQPDSMTASLSILNMFKNWVENNRGWDVIQSVEGKKCEKVVQRLVHLGAKAYIESNKLDISFEPDEGRGPVDFKVSRGADKTIVEIKLSSNGQYRHGYEVQLQEYGKAETTDKLVYVFVDVGNSGRLKTIIELHEKSIAEGKKVPEFVVISALKKDSASTYSVPPDIEA